MKTFQHTCLTLEDVCSHNNLDYERVIRTIENSDVSFGNNDDTLITIETFEKIIRDDFDTNKLNYDHHDEDNIMISLGS
jgi:hypothetical protein